MATSSRRTNVARGRVVAALVAIVAVVGLGVAAASPPPSAAFDDFDGRTWLAVPRATGSQLLLVNGISGSLEAEAALDPAPSSVEFVGSTTRRTLLRAPDSLIVVDNATHAATRRPRAATDRIALLGEDVLVVGDAVSRISSTGAGGPVVVDGAPAAVDDTPLVVDGRGRPWYLGRQADRTLVAVTVAAVAGGDAVPRTVAVPPSTRTLIVVDGRVHALGDDLVAVEGGRRPQATADGIAPTIAEGTGGTWATASESTVSFVNNGQTDAVDLGSAVTGLALWYGSAYAVTGTGLVRVSGTRTEPVPEIGGGASLHIDGGLLWATTPETAVAIDPNQESVVLRLASADLSLCVGDCSAAAASTFLDQVAAEIPPPAAPPSKPTSGDPAPTTTTEAPRVLAPAGVTPTLPSTTVPRSVATTTTTRPPSSVSPASGSLPAPDAAPDTTLLVPAPTTSTTAPPKDRDKDKDGGPRPDPAPVPVPRPPDTRPNPTTTTTTTTPSTTTEEPSDPVDLEYSLRGARRSATADIRVLGRPSQCGAAGVATTGTVSWTGSDSGSREVLITWPQADARRSHETSATIVAPAGELRVTVTVCGVAATRETTIEGDPVPTTTTSTTSTTTPPTTSTPTTLPPTTTPTTVRPTTTTAPTTTTPTTPTSTTPTSTTPTTTPPTTPPPTTPTTPPRPTTTTTTRPPLPAP